MADHSKSGLRTSGYPAPAESENAIAEIGLRGDDEITLLNVIVDAHLEGGDGSDLIQLDVNSTSTSRILGGLGDDIDQVPAVGLAPEWMSEKALAIGTYCVASGAYVIFGGASPVGGMPDKVEDSTIVTEIMSKGWEEQFGGKMEFIPDPHDMIEATLDHIDKKREELGLSKYDPTLFGKSGDSDMLELEELPLAERRKAIYGSAGK